MALLSLSTCIGGDEGFDDGCVSLLRRRGSWVGDGGALTAERRLGLAGGGGDFGWLAEGVTMGRPYMLIGVGRVSECPLARLRLRLVELLATSRLLFLG